MKLSPEFYFRQEAICAYRPSQNDLSNGSFHRPVRDELFSAGRQGHCRRPIHLRFGATSPFARLSPAATREQSRPHPENFTPSGLAKVLRVRTPALR
jgi:hypothetical protein